MRLDDKTLSIIKGDVATQLSTDAVVRLFGSRVDDTQRGGDIDLLIEPGQPLAHRIKAEPDQKIISASRQAWATLWLSKRRKRQKFHISWLQSGTFRRFAIRRLLGHISAEADY